MTLNGEILEAFHRNNKRVPSIVLLGILDNSTNQYDKHWKQNYCQIMCLSTFKKSTFNKSSTKYGYKISTQN